MSTSRSSLQVEHPEALSRAKVFLVHLNLGTLTSMKYSENCFCKTLKSLMIKYFLASVSFQGRYFQQEETCQKWQCLTYLLHFYLFQECLTSIILIRNINLKALYCFIQSTQGFQNIYQNSPGSESNLHCKINFDSHICYYLWLCSPLLDLGHFFSFLILNTEGRPTWKGDQPVT
jgi:hypothetical protein